MGVKLGLISRKERRLRVFENRVLRKKFGPKKDKISGEVAKLHNKELYDLYCLPSIIWLINQEERNGQGIWHIWGMGEVHTGVWWGNLRERSHLEALSADGSIILTLRLLMSYIYMERIFLMFLDHTQ